MIGPFTRMLLHGAGAAAGLAALLLALAVWRASQGPVSLAFLVPYIEAAAAAEAPGARLSLAAPVLAWDRAGRSIGVRASDIRVRLPGGAAARVPEAIATLSLPALARGVVMPRRVALRAPAIRIPAPPAAAAAAGADPPAAANGASWGEAQALLRGYGARRHLRTVSASDATVVLDTPRGRRVLSFSRLTLDRDSGGVSGAADAAFAAGGERFAFTAAARYDAGAGAATLRATLSDLVPARLARAAPEFAFAAGFDAPTSGEAVLEFDPGGAVASVSFDLAAGAGAFDAPPPYAPGTRLAMAGMRAVGRLDGDSRLEIDDLSIDFHGSEFTLRGAIGGDWERPDVALDLVARRAPLDALDAFWPHESAPGARRWAVERIRDGVLDELTVRVSVSGDEWALAYLPADRVEGRFSISGATVRYFDGLPPARGVRAAGRFDSLGVTADVAAGWTGPLDVRGTLTVRDAPDLPDGLVRASVAFSGDPGDALAMLRDSPFASGDALPFDPARVSGSVEGDIAVRMPLLEAVGRDAVGFSATAELADVALAPDPGGGAFAGRRIAGGAGALLVAKNGFDLTGEAAIDGVPAVVHWRETFAPAPGAARRTIELSAALDAAARDALGLGFDGLAGPVAAEARLTAGGAGPAAVEIALDAAAAAIDLPALAWRKPPGAPATADIALTVGADGVEEAPRFEITADGLAAAGAATRSARGWTIGLDRFSSALADVSGAVATDGDALFLLLKGRRLDLRVDDAGQARGGGAGAARRFSLWAEVDSLTLDGLPLDDATVFLSHDGRLVDRASANGRLPGGASLALRLASADAPDTRVARVDTDDAGQLFRALGITPNMVGGRLTANAEIDDRSAAAPMRGMLEVDDFRMVNAPVLAHLLNMVSVTGALETLAGEGLVFQRFEAPFGYRDGVLTLDRARVFGVSVGLTMDGAIDFHRDEVDVGGEIVPFYALNSIVGAVPLIGDLLTGGEGKGVIAASWRASGDRAAPSIAVNPLAMLAPGFLREFLMDGPLSSGG